jgi:oligo-1,6-glucosidase
VASAKTLATTLHLLKGTPYVYQGQELGMTNAGFTDIGQYNDLESLRYHAEALTDGADPAQLMAAIAFKSRDNARTPMQWDATPQAGFTTGEPWLPVTSNYHTVNAAAAIADPDSVFHHYRALIDLRHRLEVVRQGRFALLLPDDEHLFCFTRTLADEVLLVVANWSSAPVPLPASELPSLDGAQVLLGTHAVTPGDLAAWESRIYRLA